MDRRSFLKAVASVGMAVWASDLIFEEVSNEELEPVWQEMVKSPVVFEIINTRTLAIADYPEPRTRQDIYDLTPGCINSAKKLACEIYSCQPLAWRIALNHECAKDDVLDDMRWKLSDLGMLEVEIVDLLDLESLGWGDSNNSADLDRWIMSLTSADFERLYGDVVSWLEEQPDWAWELEHASSMATGQSAALSFFRDFSFDELDMLGIAIIEGDVPGSSYYAAELMVSIEEGNQMAKQLGVPLVFA